MTDNATVIIVAAVTGIPATIGAIAALTAQRGSKAAKAAAELAKAASNDTRTATLVQSNAAVATQEKLSETKAAVAEVHAMVNSNLKDIKNDLTVANDRIATQMQQIAALQSEKDLALANQRLAAQAERIVALQSALEAAQRAHRPPSERDDRP